MPTTSEQVLEALSAVLAAGLPAGVQFGRNLTAPSRIPAAGFVSLRDGDPGSPEALLSPPVYVFEHLAEVDVAVELADPAARDLRFDELKAAIGVAVAADRTLGGLCDYVLGMAPAPLELGIEGAENVKAATIEVMLTYGSSDPLA